MEVLYQQNDLLYYLLSTRLESIAPTDKEQLADSLNNVAISTNAQIVSFRLCDKSGTVLGIGDTFPIEAAYLVTKLDNNQRGWELQNVDGNYYLHAASPMSLFGETVYLENYREISDLFILRDKQYHNYFLVMVALTITATVVSLIVVALILQPLKRLSIAARKIAAGKLDERVTVTGDDELSGLSKDFNTMAAQLEQQVGELKNETKRQEDFIGSFTHELKTPLTSIIGYAELLRALLADQERVLQSAVYIFREGRRLEALSRKLLDLIVLDKQITFKSVSIGGGLLKSAG
ncbi:MAG: HAMP domain-containing protein [Lachnospiraceae bacterium]|nr:HAMP domain-containing protein [Lachnospiraceae bacterium]